jgi:hypothetical protein
MERVKGTGNTPGSQKGRRENEKAARGTSRARGYGQAATNACAARSRVAKKHNLLQVSPHACSMLLTVLPTLRL